MSKPPTQPMLAALRRMASGELFARHATSHNPRVLQALVALSLTQLSRNTIASNATLNDIPVLDVREDGPVGHARRRREAMLELREACFSVIPAALRRVAEPLDRVSRTWLLRCPSPYVGEIAEIAAIARRAGVWFVNASYEWGCTTRIEVDPVPQLRRTLDWPFPGLGRHVEVALQSGQAGVYANVTWPGAVGVLTAVAPGRFGAAINQAPMYRRAEAIALLPADFLLNGYETWRHADRWPAAHLLRYVFDHCETYEEAVTLLTETPIARPTLFSIAGAQQGEGCLIERTETEAIVHAGCCSVANDWQPGSPPRRGHWIPRGRYMSEMPSSDERRAAFDGRSYEAPFDWVTQPILNKLTRLAVELSPATGEFRVIGYEQRSKDEDASPVTHMFDGRISLTGAGGDAELRDPPASGSKVRLTNDGFPSSANYPDQKAQLGAVYDLADAGRAAIAQESADGD
jgi:hypothetical protein